MTCAHSSRISKADLHDLYRRASQHEIFLSTSDACKLIRAARAIHRWHEHECKGTIQQDEATGHYYWCEPNTGTRLSRCRDVYAAAVRRIATTLANRSGSQLYYFLQSDPRGGTLRLSREPMTYETYTHGLLIA